MCKRSVQGTSVQQKKTSKIAHIVTAHVSTKKLRSKISIEQGACKNTLINSPSDLRKDEYYLNEEGMCELVFARQEPKEKEFRKYCCNTHNVSTYWAVADQEDGKDHQQAITEIQGGHQLARPWQTLATK